HRPDLFPGRAFGQARAAAAASYAASQRSGVLAYAITAALGRGRKDLASAMLEDALAILASVEPMASRAYALHLLWSTLAHNGDAKMREAVIVALQAHVHPDRSWRARRLYRDIVDWLAARDPRKADAIAGAMPDGKARAYLQRRRASNSPRSPGA